MRTQEEMIQKAQAAERTMQKVLDTGAVKSEAEIPVLIAKLASTRENIARLKTMDPDEFLRRERAKEARANLARLDDQGLEPDASEFERETESAWRAHRGDKTPREKQQEIAKAYKEIQN
jgi:hypothetical protein